jgi:hypothetical protein
LFSVLRFIYFGKEPKENFQEFTKLAKHLQVKGIGDNESLAGIFIAKRVFQI